LRRWVDASEIDEGNKAGLTTAEKAEIRDLKREVATLKMERDILKKATAFFAKENQ
jgi:transposase